MIEFVKYDIDTQASKILELELFERKIKYLPFLLSQDPLRLCDFTLELSALPCTSSENQSLKIIFILKSFHMVNSSSVSKQVKK